VKVVLYSMAVAQTPLRMSVPVNRFAPAPAKALPLVKRTAILFAKDTEEDPHSSLLFGINTRTKRLTSGVCSPSASSSSGSGSGSGAGSVPTWDGQNNGQNNGRSKRRSDSADSDAKTRVKTESPLKKSKSTNGSSSTTSVDLVAITGKTTIDVAADADAASSMPDQLLKERKERKERQERDRRVTEYEAELAQHRAVLAECKCHICRRARTDIVYYSTHCSQHPVSFVNTLDTINPNLMVVFFCLNNRCVWNASTRESTLKLWLYASRYRIGFCWVKNMPIQIR